MRRGATGRARRSAWRWPGAASERPRRRGTRSAREARDALARSPAALVLAPFGAVAFTLVVSALLVLWAGAPVRPHLRAAVRRAASARCFAWSETLTRATPLILTGLAAAVAFQRAPLQHRRRGPALRRRARGGRGRRAARRQRLRAPPWLLFPLMMARRGARRRAAAARPGAAEARARRRRGRDDAAAQLHRAAVRRRAARRPDEGPDRDGLAAERGAAGRARARQADRAARACTPACSGRVALAVAAVGAAQVHGARLRHPRASAPTRAPPPSPACR